MHSGLSGQEGFSVGTLFSITTCMLMVTVEKGMSWVGMITFSFWRFKKITRYSGVTIFVCI